MKTDLFAGCLSGHILRIDRSKRFDLDSFAKQNGYPNGLGDQWKIVEEDQGSLSLFEINPMNIHLASTGHTRVVDRIEFLKSSHHTRADARVFEHLWMNREVLNNWIRPDGNNGHISFEGTLFARRNKLGVIEIIHDGNEWKWNIHRLNDDGSTCDLSPSVVIENSGGSTPVS